MQTPIDHLHNVLGQKGYLLFAILSFLNKSLEKNSSTCLINKTNNMFQIMSQWLQCDIMTKITLAISL